MKSKALSLFVLLALALTAVPASVSAASPVQLTVTPHNPPSTLKIPTSAGTVTRDIPVLNYDLKALGSAAFLTEMHFKVDSLISDTAGTFQIEKVLLYRGSQLIAESAYTGVSPIVVSLWPQGQYLTQNESVNYSLVLRVKNIGTGGTVGVTFSFLRGLMQTGGDFPVTGVTAQNTIQVTHTTPLGYKLSFSVVPPLRPASTTVSVNIPVDLAFASTSMPQAIGRSVQISDAIAHINISGKGGTINDLSKIQLVKMKPDLNMPVLARGTVMGDVVQFEPFIYKDNGSKLVIRATLNDKFKDNQVIQIYIRPNKDEWVAKDTVTKGDYLLDNNTINFTPVKVSPATTTSKAIVNVVSTSISKGMTGTVNGVSTSTVTAVFNLEITAQGGNVNFPSAAFKFNILKNGQYFFPDVASTITYTSPWGPNTATGPNGQFTLFTGKTVSLPVTVVFEGRTKDGKPLPAGMYSTSLRSVKYDDYLGSTTSTYIEKTTGELQLSRASAGGDLYASVLSAVSSLIDYLIN